MTGTPEGIPELRQAHRVHRVLLPENVELRFSLAEPGSRIAAGTIDYALLYSGVVACILAMARFREHLRDLDQLLHGVPLLDDPYFPETMMALLLFGVFAAWWGYFVLFELIWNGQTPGKRLLGLRVVQANGTPLSPAASLVRNILRAIDAVALLGVIVMFVDGRSRRLGDFAAGTLVVRATQSSEPAITAPVALPPRPEDVARLVPLVHRLNRQHHALIRDTFARQGSMPEHHWDVMAHNLSSQIAGTMGVEPPDEFHAAQFLADVVHAIDASQRHIEVSGPDR